MSLISRVQRGIQVGLEAARGTNSVDQIRYNLDELMSDPALKDYVQDQEAYKALQKQSKSFLTIRRTSDTMMSYYNLLTNAVRKNQLPPHGDPTRDIVLAEFWKDEPILAGAVYSMSAKMTSLSWTVIGRKVLANSYAKLFARSASMDGYDWGGFISASSQDFYTTDRGNFWETPRYGNRVYGRLADLGHIDSLQCAMTGNSQQPVFYLSDVTGQQRYFRPGEYIHFSSLPSPRESLFGVGYCASSRAYKAAKLLLGLHDYDSEKLANLPPEGVAAVSGLTMDEFQDALAVWKASRQKHNSLTFPQVLWLVGQQPNTPVGLNFIGFSQIPESFDRGIVVEQYVNTLALVFGVDAREFWPISTSSLGTAAESEIQHMKAKGKGPGEFVSIVERKLNGELPDGVEFSFDTQDIAEDKQAAEVAKTWIEAFLPLVTGGSAGGPKATMGGPNPLGHPGRPEGGETASKFSPAGGPINLNKQDPMAGFDSGIPGENGQSIFSQPEPQPGPGEEEQPQEESGFITRQEFLRLLADRGVIPNYLVKDKRIVVTDSGIEEKETESDEFVMYRWKQGVLTRERLPSYTVISEGKTAPKEPIKALPLTTEILTEEDIVLRLKQLADEILEDERNIKGKPIPEKEALRGNKITSSAVKAELDRWRAHPILAKYVPTVEEGDDSILDTVTNA